MSIVSETMQDLSRQASLWHDRLDLIEAGQPINRAELMADFGGLLELCQNLRDAVLSEDRGARWTTKDELNALVDRLEGAAAIRTRYLDLAHLLSIGTVVHHRERTRLERLQLRDAAVAELMQISESATPPELPGPSTDVWLQWACGLEDGSNDPGLVLLPKFFPRVDDFVRQLDIKTWQEGVRLENDSKPALKASAPVKSAEPKRNWNGDTWRNSAASERAETSVDEPGAGASVEPALPVMTVPAVELPSASMVGASVVEIHAAASEGVSSLPDVSSFNWNPVAQVEPAEQKPVGAVELEESSSSVAVAIEAPEEEKLETAKLQRTKAKGLVSFFPEEEVECFSLYLEKSKHESKDARKVRALFAISHWLSPVNQNPVSHPKCGIRAQVDYSGATDMAPSTPTEASKAISTHNKLLLFTGGADLLRWSLSQPPNGHFDGLATVRRLSVDHIRTWFRDLYKIELAEPQLADIYRLTSGIPVLVGEMHRLIVPEAVAPPSWLGFELWNTVMTGFGNRLPAIAHELGSGSSTIRLTEREIEILKMMVIASDDFTTPESLAAGLTTDWSDYRHPEFLALSSSDNESVALLERLGLLPTREGSGMTPIQSLVPLEHGDALRQVVRYL